MSSCRDCADELGTCPRTGNPCAAAEEQFKQPHWGHVQQAFFDGAREARANPDADESLFKRAADSYTKRVFEDVDPDGERRLRTGDFNPQATAPGQAATDPSA